MIWLEDSVSKVRRFFMWHKSGAMRWVCCLVWLVTAFASLHYGMVQMGYDLRTTALLATLGPVVNYVFAVAGLVSLVWWVMHLLKGCGECH